MKNYVKILACISLLALAMTAFCACDTDWYQGRRPTDQPGTKWVCEKYGMSFEVDENGLVKNGVLKTEGGDIYFDFLFDGMCEFGRNSCEIDVEHDPNGYFPNGCTLHFDRVEE